MIRPTRHLNSGEFHFSEDDQWIITSLGSCVAVCVYDRRLKFGGICHFLLPSREGISEKSSTESAPWKFGDEAIPSLLRMFKQRGSDKSDLEITLVGACDLSSPAAPASGTGISKLNLKCAERALQRLGLPVARQRTGGNPRGLLLRFNPATGELNIKPVERDASLPVSDEPAPSQLNAKAATPTIKVLIVDDAPVFCKALSKELSRFPDLEIVGEATSAATAEIYRKERSPDVMTLDIKMPEKDGIQYLAETMVRAPMPVIMISDLNKDQAGPVLRAFELGAFEYLQKPSSNDFKAFGDEVHALIVEAYKSRKASNSVNRASAIDHSNVDKSLKLIAIGASTGGTEALKVVMAKCPADAPPVVIVQHMPALFTAEFAKSLGKICKLKVKEAENGDILERGCAYIAPGGHQMKVVRDRVGALKIRITDDPPVNRFKPSVDYLFFSLKELNLGQELRAAILTGMGDDGARGMLALRKAGSYTVAQNEETSAVYGMPKAAADLGAAQRQLPLELIMTDLISEKIQKKSA